MYNLWWKHPPTGMLTLPLASNNCFNMKRCPRTDVNCMGVFALSAVGILLSAPASNNASTTNKSSCYGIKKINLVLI